MFVCVCVCTSFPSSFSFFSRLFAAADYPIPNPENMFAQACCFHPASPRTDPKIQTEGMRR